MKVFKLTMRLYVCQIILAITTLIFIAPLYKMTQNNPRLFSLITGLVYLMVMYSAVWRAGRADSRKIPGYYPDKNRCTCSEKDMIQYWNRLSGPLLYRIDMFVETARVDLMKLQGTGKEESTEAIRKRVEKARKIQEKRFVKKNYTFNSEMKAADIDEFCLLGKREKRLMEIAYTKMKLSARTYHRVLKVARTIADLDGSDVIKEKHISEALAYRLTERGDKENG